MVEGMELGIKPPAIAFDKKDSLHKNEKGSPLKPTELSNETTIRQIGELKEAIKGTSKPEYDSSFTKEVSGMLTNCGIQVDYVNPKPIGEGANHLVYRYTIPGETERVIKIAKPASTTTLTQGVDEEKSNTDFAVKYFSKYAVDTQILSDPTNPKLHCVVQEEVKGKPLDNMVFKENANIRKQLAEIIAMNNKLYKEQKMSLDFVGMPGFMGWLKKQFGKLLMRKSTFDVSNILVDKNGSLKIIDFEYFKYRGNIGLKKRATNFVGMLVNRILMKHYFGLDIKKG